MSLLDNFTNGSKIENLPGNINKLMFIFRFISVVPAVLAFGAFAVLEIFFPGEAKYDENGKKYYSFSSDSEESFIDPAVERISSKRQKYIEEVQRGKISNPQLKKLTGDQLLVTGDMVSLGRYEQDGNYDNGPEKIIWRILYNKENQILMVSALGLEVRPFDNSNNIWDDSELKTWLETYFKNSAFSAQEQSLIDNIGLLDKDEVKTYFKGSGDRIIAPTDYASSQRPNVVSNVCSWWLRSSADEDKKVAVSGFGGMFSTEIFNDHTTCVRPAILIKRNHYDENVNENIR